jgi:hypothetical protein
VRNEVDLGESNALYVCVVIGPSKVKVRSCGMDATLKVQADMPHAHKSRKEDFFGGLESQS